MDYITTIPMYIAFYVIGLSYVLDLVKNIIRKVKRRSTVRSRVPLSVVCLLVLKSIGLKATVSLTVTFERLRRNVISRILVHRGVLVDKRVSLFQFQPGTRAGKNLRSF